MSLFDVSSMNKVWVPVGSPKTQLTHGEIMQNITENTTTVFQDNRLTFWMTAGKEIENMKKNDFTRRGNRPE